jgi:hypothetical protein
MEIIYVLFAIVQCAIVMIILDLWMLRMAMPLFPWLSILLIKIECIVT